MKRIVMLLLFGWLTIGCGDEKNNPTEVDKDEGLSGNWTLSYRVDGTLRFGTYYGNYTDQYVNTSLKLRQDSNTFSGERNGGRLFSCTTTDCPNNMKESIAPDQVIRGGMVNGQSVFFYFEHLGYHDEFTGTITSGGQRITGTIKRVPRPSYDVTGNGTWEATRK